MTSEEKRLKEIKKLKYLKSLLITQTKKEIKQLQEEENMIYGYHKITNSKNKYNKKGKVK